MTQQTNSIYTYHHGEKLNLSKRPRSFVTRLELSRARAFSVDGCEAVSPASSRILDVPPGDLESLMSRARSVAPTFHDYEVAETGEEFLITDRILVRFRDSMTDDQVDLFAGRYGLLIKTRYSDQDVLFQLTQHTGENPVKLVVRLSETEPQVALAEHDLNQRVKMSAPLDRHFLAQWHLHKRSTHPQVDPRSSSRCEEAWDILQAANVQNSQVVVGVTDDGMRMDHQDFNSPSKFAGWGYFRGERLIRAEDVDAHPSQMYIPGNNHGTSCAGVIAAELDAVLTVGAAPFAKLLPIRWEADGSSLFISDSKILTALFYLKDKVDILSNSWGNSPSMRLGTKVIETITELAKTGGPKGKGILFLWAAGNENCPIQHRGQVDVPVDHGWVSNPPRWVGPETSRVFVHNLVGIPGVMHIAALASTARRSHYSNYGTGISLCAPTNNVHTYYRGSAPGLGVTTTTGEAERVTSSFGGTSSATPLVAGVCALVRAANPELTALEVERLLKRTASRDLDLRGYPRTPPASYDPNPSWDVSPIAPFDKGDFRDLGSPEGTWSPWFGFGKVDAAAAVAEALDLKVAPQQVVVEDTVVVRIPDNVPAGIRRSLQIPSGVIISELAVSVDITHSWIGDLRILLAPPTGEPIPLFDQEGGDADNLVRTFGTQEVPALETLQGRDAGGVWSLLVADLASQDEGKLNRWSLSITT